MKKGFTLVELSIVLVIIGLLIGGILVGQALIESAKINKAVRQIQQFDIAVQQFKTKYKSLPGDYSGFEHGGNEDGIIDDSYTNSNPTTFYFPRDFIHEINKFWPSLQLNGFKIEGITSQLTFHDNSTYINPEASGSNQNIPSFSLGEKTGVIPLFHTKNRGIGWQVSIGSQSLGETINSGLFYFLADFDTADSSTFYSSSGYDESIPVLAAYNLDLKIDDGNNNTGNVINFSYTASGLQPGCVINNSSIKYSIDVENGKCALIVRAEVY